MELQFFFLQVCECRLGGGDNEDVGNLIWLHLHSGMVWCVENVAIDVESTRSVSWVIEKNMSILDRYHELAI